MDSPTHQTPLIHTTPPTLSIPVERTPGSIRARRESILNNDFGSFRGVNTLGRFASSFTRAQSFRTLDANFHTSRSFFRDGDDEIYYPDTLAPASVGNRLSNLLNDFTSFNEIMADDDAIDDASVIGVGSYSATPNPMNSYNTQRSKNNSFRRDRNDSVFSYAASSVRLAPVLSSGSLRDAMETTPLVLRQVEDADGNKVTLIAGQSTKPQTIFNSINVLIGVGLLALSVGLHRAGWVIGVPMLLLCGYATYWSAQLLSKCMDTDPTLLTYADLGYAAYGARARLFISILFSIDLMGAGVALIVLFSDSLNALFPQLSKLQFKVVAFVVLTPFTFFPLRVLSMISLMGIMATITVVLTVLAAGLAKQTGPGSLINPMPTNLFPESFQDVLIAIGILMAPFGGHAIFPALKADMRHPQRFNESLKVTYSITLLTDTAMAVIGFLMFGSLVNNEITNNVLLTPGYPKFIYGLISALISIVPLAKTPLNARPIISTLDILFNVDSVDTDSNKDPIKNFKYFFKSGLKFSLRVFVNFSFVFIAIIYPEFDRIIGIMGASICFLICLILPCSFYLRICGNTASSSEKLVCYFVILVSSILAVVGTYAAVSL